MNLETLLEAAEFLELKSIRQPKTRGRDDVSGYFSRTEEFHRYAKSLPTPVHFAKPKSPRDDDYLNADEDLLSRERRRAGGAGTREVHNKLEKNRRAHLKECFDVLRGQLPGLDDKKVSNLTILRHALAHIQVLKSRDSHLEKERHQLNKRKKNAQNRIVELRQELAGMNIEINLSDWIKSQDQESNSTSTATEIGDDKCLSSDDGDEDSDTDSDIEVDIPVSPKKDKELAAAKLIQNAKESFTNPAPTRTALTFTVTPPTPPVPTQHPQVTQAMTAVPALAPPSAPVKQQTDTQRALQQHILKQQQRAQMPTVKTVMTNVAPQRSTMVTTKSVAGSPFTHSTVKLEGQGQVIKKITHVQPTATPGGTVVTTASRITLVNKVLHKAITSPIQMVNRGPLPNQVQNLVVAGSANNQLIGNPQISGTVPHALGSVVTTPSGLGTPVATMNLGHLQGLRVVGPGQQGAGPQIVAPMSNVATLQMMAKIPQTNAPLLAGLSLQPHVMAPGSTAATYIAHPTLSFLPAAQQAKGSSVPIGVSTVVSHQGTTSVVSANTSAAVAALLSAAGAIQPPITTNAMRTMVSTNPMHTMVTANAMHTMVSTNPMHTMVTANPMHTMVSTNPMHTMMTSNPVQHRMMTPMTLTPISVSTVHTSGPTHILSPQILNSNLQHLVSPTATLLNKPNQQIVLKSTLPVAAVKSNVSHNHTVGMVGTAPASMKPETVVSSAEPSKP